MAKQTFDPECPRCGAHVVRIERETSRIPASAVAYECGSWTECKSHAKRLGLKWDGRLRVGKDCDPKRKGKT